MLPIDELCKGPSTNYNINIPELYIYIIYIYISCIIYIYILISRSVLYPAQVIAHPKKNMKTISADVSWTVGGPPSYNSGSIFLRFYLYH